MAWNIKVPPADVIVASVAATFSIALDKGNPGRFVLSYTDEDGLPFSRQRTFTLDVDGKTLFDMDRNQGVNWNPPDPAAFTKAAECLSTVVQALVDQNLATPKR